MKRWRQFDDDSAFRVRVVGISREVLIHEFGNEIDVFCGTCTIATHVLAAVRGQVVTSAHHHEGIPLGAKSTGKTLVHIRQNAPDVERRPLSAYDILAGGVQ